VGTGGVGLVLGAGGVIGHAWHAGVVAALAEEGWDARRADVVVGTSAGSVVAALLRADLDPVDIYARAVDQPLSPAGQRIVAAGLGSRPLAPPSFRPPSRGGWAPAAPRTVLRALNPLNPRFGLLTGALPRGTNDTAMISDGIGRLHAEGWPAAPMWICAVRLRDGRRVVFGRDVPGDVVDAPGVDAGPAQVPVGLAVAASCAIPGFFAPVAVDGVDHVDGGVHSPTNADLLTTVRPRLVVVSSPMSMDRSALRGMRPDRALRLGHRTTLLREVAALRRAGAAVISLQPGPDDIAAMGPPGTAMDPRRRGPVALQARETTLRRLQRAPVRDALAGG
jgi:NTE family protein